MAFERNLEKFLANSRLTPEDFQKANIKWADLLEIGDHKEKNEYEFRAAAETIANSLQRVDAIHSVRWRVKDTEHLIAKIIRKRVENSKKYSAINIENYTEIVRDIIGVRALHLFKDEYLSIDNAVREKFDLAKDERVIAYIRKGDDEKAFNRKLLKRYHKDGYRSIHYILKPRILKEEFFCELQVRTLFEEGWSEIDHKVRYPNFTSNELIKEYLMVFNRICGSADDMATFVETLASGIQNYSNKVDYYDSLLSTEISKTEEIADKLKSKESKAAQQEELIRDLQLQIAKIRDASDFQRTKHLTDDYFSKKLNSNNNFNITRPFQERLDANESALSAFERFQKAIHAGKSINSTRHIQNDKKNK